MAKIAKIASVLVLMGMLVAPAMAAPGDAGSGPTMGATPKNDAGSGPTKGYGSSGAGDSKQNSSSSGTMQGGSAGATPTTGSQQTNPKP